MIAGAGFDWILLDSEHSPADIENLLTQLQAAAPYPTHPVVRIPWNDMVTIKRVLDIGAQSLLVPYVSSADEARAAVSYTRYPPAGVRGVAGTTRATRFGASRTTRAARTRRRSASSCRWKLRARSTASRRSVE